MTDFLHYNDKTAGRKLKDATKIFEAMGVKTDGIDMNKSYFDQLVELVKDLSLKEIKETELLEKTVLGIGIRVLSDYYLYNKFIEKNGKTPEFPPKQSSTTYLYDETKMYIGSEELSIIDLAHVIAPSFIHINGFMYEPLIDVSGAKIVECTTKLLEINGL